MNGLTRRVNGLAGRMNGLTRRVNGLCGRMNGLIRRTNGLAGRTNGLIRRLNGFAGSTNASPGSSIVTAGHGSLAAVGSRVQRQNGGHSRIYTAARHYDEGATEFPNSIKNLLNNGISRAKPRSQHRTTRAKILKSIPVTPFPSVG
jgi:hypothetical protein